MKLIMLCAVFYVLCVHSSSRPPSYIKSAISSVKNNVKNFFGGKKKSVQNLDEVVNHDDITIDVSDSDDTSNEMNENEVTCRSLSQDEICKLADKGRHYITEKKNTVVTVETYSDVCCGYGYELLKEIMGNEVEVEISGIKVREVSMRHLQLNDIDAKDISKVLKMNTKIRSLDMSDNNITDVGLKYILDSFEQNKTVYHLKMHSNRIEGKRLTDTKHFKNNKLLYLDLEKNNITDDVSLITDYFENFDALTGLGLAGNPLSLKSAATIVSNIHLSKNTNEHMRNRFHLHIDATHLDFKETHSLIDLCKMKIYNLMKDNLQKIVFGCAIEFPFENIHLVQIMVDGKFTMVTHFKDKTEECFLHSACFREETKTCTVKFMDEMERAISKKDAFNVKWTLNKKFKHQDRTI